MRKMINEKRLCQLMIPCYILFHLTRDDQDESSVDIRNYVSKYMGFFCDYNRKKFNKLSVRLAKRVGVIENFCSEKGVVKGKKMVLITHFLTEIIFKKKEGKITDTYVEIAAITKRLVEFCSKMADSEIEDEDFDKLVASTEKQAGKVYERFYKLI